MEMPVLAKENSLIAYGDFEENFEYNYADNTEIVWYSPVENTPAETEIADKNGNTVLKIRLTKQGNNIKTDISSEGNFNIRLRINGTDFSRTINGTGSLELTFSI